jgi:hypothetical protein
MSDTRADTRRSSSAVRRVTWLVCLLTSAYCLLPAVTARADTPAGAVERLVGALRANDRAAYLEALAEDYAYNGARRSDLDPFGTFGVVNVQLFSRITQLQLPGPDVATALVDITLLGFFNLEALNSGRPPVAGTRRLWLELRRQQDGSWRVSALRTVHRRLLTAGWPAGDDPRLSGVGVNGRPSTRLRPGAVFTLAGQSTRGNLLLVGLGASGGQLPLQQKENEPWSVELKAPDQPGCYAVTAVLAAQRPVTGGFAISWDEVTVPIVVE